MSGMGLVEHAERELRACGAYAEDPEWAASIVRAVEGFTSYGHSGGSAGVAIAALHDLLQFKPLSPLTTDPDEWMDVAEAYGNQRAVWQSCRRADAFSNDGGRTYYTLDERDDPERFTVAWWRKRLRLGPPLHEAVVRVAP